MESKPLTTEEQNELLNRLLVMLQSIACQAVKAQDNMGNPDFVFDMLEDIAQDLNKALDINSRLAK